MSTTPHGISIHLYIIYSHIRWLQTMRVCIPSPIYIYINNYFLNVLAEPVVWPFDHYITIHSSTFVFVMIIVDGLSAAHFIRSPHLHWRGGFDAAESGTPQAVHWGKHTQPVCYIFQTCSVYIIAMAINWRCGGMARNGKWFDEWNVQLVALSVMLSVSISIFLYEYYTAHVRCCVNGRIHSLTIN